MKGNRKVKLIEIPIEGKAGFSWNRLHEEREEICEALLNRPVPLREHRKRLFEARLRAVDDALDRLMAGSYGNCSKCGQSIDDTGLDIDPALSECLECWTSEHGRIPSECDATEVLLVTLKPFDIVLLQTHNSDYRILLLDPMTGRAMVEGGDYLEGPSEALVRGSAFRRQEFKPGAISVGGQLEMLVNERVLLTSIITSVHVRSCGEPAPVVSISSALH